MEPDWFDLKNYPPRKDPVYWAACISTRNALLALADVWLDGNREYVKGIFLFTVSSPSRSHEPSSIKSVNELSLEDLEQLERFMQPGSFPAFDEYKSSLEVVLSKGDTF